MRLLAPVPLRSPAEGGGEESLHSGLQGPPPGTSSSSCWGENRYASLKLSFPEKAQELYEKAERDAKERLESYLRLAEK